MASFLPPVVVEVPAESARRGTVIACDDRSINVLPAGESKVIGWLEANGVVAKHVLTDQIIGAGGDRIRCDAVLLDERGNFKLTEALDGVAVEHIDVPLTVAPEAFGL